MAPACALAADLALAYALDAGSEALMAALESLCAANKLLLRESRNLQVPPSCPTLQQWPAPRA